MSEESTTPDPVRLIRDLFEAMDRDWDIDALEAAWAPDIVWDMSQSALGTLHGRAEVREFLESWWATRDDHHHHIEEVRDYGYGVVLIVLLEDGRPVGSQGRVQAQNVMVHELVDSKTVRIASHADIDEAGAAAERIAQERA